MYDPYADFSKHILSNGLEVHFAFADRSWIKAEVVIHSGGREDLITMPGVAHFVEHLVSENIPDWEYDKAKEFFEVCGGRVEFGATHYLATKYSFSIPDNLATLDKALTIFGSMLLHARLEKEVERERKIIFREFNGTYPFLDKLEWDMGTSKALFKGHRLETYNSPLGRPEGFLSATEADLQGFYDEHYVPSNMSLIIVGGISIEELLPLLEKSPFGMKKLGVRNPIPPPFKELPIPEVKSKTVKMSDYSSFKVDQTKYKAKWAIPANFPKQARRVFNLVLGKILFDEIREKRGLAYSIGSDFAGYHDVYEYKIGGRISPDATPYIDELVRNCINMVSERRDLFDRKLKSCIQGCLMTDLSGKALVDLSGSDLIFNHRIVTMQEVWDDLHQVTFDQMAEAASFLDFERQYTFITTP